MNKKIILIIALLSIFLIGCTDKKVEVTLVEDGRVELEAHNYSESMKLLSTALESDKENTHARAMYMQAMKMQNVDKYKSQNSYRKAISELEEIEKIKNGSSVIKTEASNQLKEIKKQYESQLAAEKKRKEEAKITASKDSYKASQQLKAEEEKMKAEEEKKKQEEQKEKEKLENEKNEPSVNNQTESAQTQQSQELQILESN